MGPTETNKIAEFPLFDWLRIAMALLVAASHFSLIPWEHAGNLGVQVFFALSGWLIGSILIEIKADKLPLFYFNRATRVWIPYFAAVATLYGLSALRDPINLRWLEFLAYDVTFTHNLFTLIPDAKAALAQMPLQGTGNHFWSLAVEEQFYLAAPLIILIFRYGRHPVTWLCIAVAMLFIRQEFSAIAFGVTAAALHHIRPGFQHHKIFRAVFVLIVILTGAALFSSSYPLAVPFFAIAVVLLCATPGNRSVVGRFVGGVSYPLYLNHWIALVGISSVVKRVGGNSTLWACFGMLVAFAIGSTAYLIIDRPVLKWRRSWFTPRLGWSLAATSYSLLLVGLTIGVYTKLL